MFSVQTFFLIPAGTEVLKQPEIFRYLQTDLQTSFLKTGSLCGKDKAVDKTEVTQYAESRLPNDPFLISWSKMHFKMEVFGVYVFIQIWHLSVLPH